MTQIDDTKWDHKVMTQSSDTNDDKVWLHKVMTQIDDKNDEKSDDKSW